MRLEAAHAPVARRPESAATAPGTAAAARLHASCVAIGGRGVVLLGPSGSGKSDLALRLIDAGGVLVADDQLLVERAGDGVLGRPVEALAGLLEVRGVGIFRLPHGAPRPLALLVELVAAECIERWPPGLTRTLLGVELPCCRLDPRAPAAAAVIRVTLRAERLA